MTRSLFSLCLASTALASLTAAAHAAPPGFDKIDTVVVIYAENRSFDNLYGGFPGANGLANVSADQA
ncbi:MAG: acid phosphatase, partial [Mesorhizobium sp.]